jgi:hypothetical protein
MKTVKLPSQYLYGIRTKLCNSPSDMLNLGHIS